MKGKERFAAVIVSIAVLIATITGVGPTAFVYADNTEGYEQTMDIAEASNAATAETEAALRDVAQEVAAEPEAMIHATEQETEVHMTEPEADTGEEEEASAKESGAPTEKAAETEAVPEKMTEVQEKLSNDKADEKAGNTETESKEPEVMAAKEEQEPEVIVAAAPIAAANNRAAFNEERLLIHSKTASYAGNGLYDITLKIKGHVGSETSKTPIDVLVILDKSGSMSDSMGSQSKWNAAKSAISAMVNSFSANENLDVRYSIVTYSGDKGSGLFSPDEPWDDAQVVQDWTESMPAVTGNPDGGTNYQAGLRTGLSQLNKARSNALKGVIFLSDGQPTYYYDSDGYTKGAGNADADGSDFLGNLINLGSCSNAAYAQAEQITNANFFYTVGCGNDLNVTTLTNLSAKVKAASGEQCIVNEGNAPLLATSTEDLISIFDDIEKKISEFMCTNVAITDTLSGWTELTDAGGTPITDIGNNYTVTVKDKNGNVVEGELPEGTTVVYDNTTKQIKLNFPADYELKREYTYEITFRIRPSEAALMDYAANGVYPNVGDAGTGDGSAGAMGYFSNEEATVSYTYREQNKTENFGKPVVQLGGTVSVTKNAEGLPDDMDNKTYSFTLSGLPEGTDYSKFHINGSGGTVEGNKLTLKNNETAEFIAWTGTNITVTEDTEAAKVQYYDLTITEPSVSKAVPETGTADITVTNAYTRKAVNVTVAKIVDGLMGDKTKDFAFKAEYTDANGAAQTEAFTLKDAESKIIKVYAGSDIIITETNAASYITTATADDELVNVTGAKEDAEKKLDAVRVEETERNIDIKNFKDVIPDTGVDTDDNTARIILVDIAIAGMAAAFFAVRKKRHRG